VVLRCARAQAPNTRAPSRRLPLRVSFLAGVRGLIRWVGGHGIVRLNERVRAEAEAVCVGVCDRGVCETRARLGGG